MNIFHTHQLPGRTVSTTDGRQLLWFSGTDYLGMGHHEGLRSHIARGLEWLGNHYGSSRNNSLRLDIYEEAEQHFAQYINTEAALLVSSGMWAGQLVMKEIEAIVPCASGVCYHYAPGVHPALWGKDFKRTDAEWSEWAQSTVEQVRLGKPDLYHVICIDAVGSPMVQAFDFSIFNALEDMPNVWLVVDESHSLGVHGAEGKGTGCFLSEPMRTKTIFVSSLNKAMGIPAGVVWGEKRVIECLRRSPWFAGASPPAPAFAYAFKAGLQAGIYSEAYAALLENVSSFSQRMSSTGLFTSIPGYPVFCSADAVLFDHLLQHGIMASCFPYPSPADAPVTRIAVSSLHQQKDLDRLAEVCKQFKAD